MRSIICGLCILAAPLLMVEHAIAQPSATLQKSPPKGFQSIFNGTDLSGWYGWNPHDSQNLHGEAKEANLKLQRQEFSQHWKVENGELVNSGTGPYATTEQSYANFELLIEYKTVAGADSGIYLRGCPQVQIWDINQPYDLKNPERKPHQGSGGLFNNTPRTLGRDPNMVADRPFGEWNQLKIRMIGSRVWVTLNTRMVVDGAILENYWDRAQPVLEQGPIQLQTHGGEIRWRNIFVREIPDAEAKKALDGPRIPNPDVYDFAYGTHPKQVLHFWKAKATQPTPLVFSIHGGGWNSGGRLNGAGGMLIPLLDAGISVVSVEYRFISEATKDGLVPPVKGPMHDAARALQTVRSKANEWNIDPRRIAATGGSAGACTSLWLAFHADLADPDSSDPISHQSTRLMCAAVTGAQTSLDPAQMKEWTPNSRYGGHAFGFAGDRAKGISQFDEFLSRRESILPWIAEYSPYALVTSDDPPVFLYYAAAPNLGQPEKDPTHSANFGLKLQEHCQSTGVPCELAYPGSKGNRHDSVLAYLLSQLKP